MTQLKELLKLSVSDRIHLVETIWDSIALDSAISKINPSHKKIIKKRLQKYLDNPSDVMTWEQVKKEIEKVL